jgi:non-ribosomal peptide synthetase component E (peptide arylation enzyme)
MIAAAPETRPSPPRDVFAALDLSAIIHALAGARPNTPLLTDRTGTLDAGTLEAQVAHLSGALQALGLRSGERILLTGGTQKAVVVALAAALRSGLDVALFPLHLPLKALATYVRDVGAVAVIGPTSYGGLPFGDTWLAAAADTPNLRFVATIGPDEADGAVDLSPAGLERAGFDAKGPHVDGARARIITAERGPAGVRAIMHHQATIMMAGLDLVARAGIGHRTPILSTLAPVSFAGLASGPIAALLAGTQCVLDGPFATADFLSACTGLQRPHLVVPAAMGADVARAGLTADLASLLLLGRAGSLGTLGVPAHVDAACPILDLYAIGETALVPELRRQGSAASPAAEAHRVSLDGRDILAVEKSVDAGGTTRLRGAAVTAATII